MNIREILSQKDEIYKAHSEDAAEKTALALSDISGGPVSVGNSVVDVVEIGRINNLYGNVNGRISLVKLNVQGKLKGEIFLLPSSKDAEVLTTDLASRRTHGEISEDVKNSVLGEIGNILAATYITAIGKYFGDILMPSVPRLSFLESSGLVQKYISENTDIPSRALMIACDFVVGNGNVRVPFLFLLKPDSIDTFTGKA
ncbi:MAG: chemotaxis protein CheC [Deltaproteobacteria bacterium]|uniref:Chemotaxis protein CheC n=1 Tax=Candidatus Zymogenus saltonus TaxID=2844893 RepID=A0A9D8PMY0_9DELT|nr:chemotaxis protein CheC [Candidatus Zymogenus saltonus]